MNTRGYVSVLRRWPWLIGLCVIVVTVADLSVMLLRPDEYSATATVLGRSTTLDRALGRIAGDRAADASGDAAAAVEILSSASVEEVATRLMLTNDDLRDKVEVRAEPNSEVVKRVVAVDSDPDLASRLANALVERYLGARRDLDERGVERLLLLAETKLSKLSRVERRDTKGAALRSEITALRAVRTHAAAGDLVRRASPPSRLSMPKLAQNVGLGAIVGLLLGIGVVFIVDRHHRRPLMLNDRAAR